MSRAFEPIKLQPDYNLKQNFKKGIDEIGCGIEKDVSLTHLDRRSTSLHLPDPPVFPNTQPHASY